jgi:membrane protein YqaA with SNARE-associated domain
MAVPPPPIGVELLVFGYLGVFLIGLGLGIIPFFGPSNMLIAFLITWWWPWGVPLDQVPLDALIINVLLVSLAISLGVSLAKSIHYYVILKSRHFLSEERKQGLEHAKSKIGRWASFAVFLAASTPIPDEPITVTIALMKYSWVKFLLSFFAGKMIITVAGGALGIWLGPTISELAGGDWLAIASVILTIVLTAFLLNWSLEKVASKTKEPGNPEPVHEKKEQPRKNKTSSTNVSSEDKDS